MRIQEARFGRTENGQAVLRYTLENASGMRVSFMTYGATWLSAEVPDRHGRLGEVLLGFDTFEEYLRGNRPYFGVICGRCANRIADAKFDLDGESFRLPRNHGRHCLHGGNRGFDKVAWTPEADGDGVRLSYVSAEGEQGFPGELHCSVIYSLTDANELRLSYRAETSRPTLVNLTSHGYFNLKDGGTTDILDHELTIRADRYTPTDAELIPTGNLAPVRGTPVDFTSPATVGRKLAEAGGYDHNFVLHANAPVAARLEDPVSGRVMEVVTTEPGLQLYSGQGLEGVRGKGGTLYKRYAGLCLEAQKYPDAIHHPEFPSVVLHPGETYRQETAYRFSVRPR